MPTKKVTIASVCYLFCIGSFLLLLHGCSTKQTSNAVIGIPAVSNNGKYTAVVVAESEGITHQENGGYRQTNYNNIFWLKLYETSTGKLLKTKKFFEAKEPVNFSMVCYGGFDDKIWLLGCNRNGKFKASLDEVVNQQKLSTANNFDINNFPDDQRFIDAMLDKGYINFMSFNREKYQLSLTDLKIMKRGATEKDTEQNINEVMRHDNEYGIRLDTCNNAIFALAKDSMQVMEYSPSNTSIMEVNYRMYLFTAAYTVKRLGNHDSFTFFDVKQQGHKSYINSCFLKNMSTGKVIRLEQPPGYLIMHQDTVGTNAKAILTRVDTHHNKIWETATAVSTKIGYCMVSNKYCILTTNTDYMFSPHIGNDALCIIDMETGEIIKPQLNY